MAVLSLAGMHQPGDIVLPMARILHVPDPGTTLRDIDEMTYRLGGRAAKPKRALAWKGPRGDTTLIHGLGIAEAAEIQEMAYALHEKEQQRQKETRDDTRERVGLPSLAASKQRIMEAMQAKADWFKRNPSEHQANYDPTQRTVF